MFSFFRVYRRLADAEGQLDASKARIADLKEQVALLESEKKTLMDWLLTLNGAPTMYSAKPPDTRREQPVHDNPTAGARNARDYQRLAEQALNMQFPGGQN